MSWVALVGTNPIVTGVVSSALTIPLTRLIGGAIDRRNADKVNAIPPQPDLELLPLRWDLEVRVEQPTLNIQFYAVNRSSKPLKIDKLLVRQFCPNYGTTFNNLELKGDYTIPGRTTTIVTVTHNLIESEISSVKTRGVNGPNTTGISYIATWRDHKHRDQSTSQGSHSIFGQISLPVVAATQEANK